MFKLKIQCNTVKKKKKPAAVFLPNMVPTYMIMMTPGVVGGEKKQPGLSSKYNSCVEMCLSSRFTLHLMKHTQTFYTGSRGDNRIWWVLIYASNLKPYYILYIKSLWHHCDLFEIRLSIMKHRKKWRLKRVEEHHEYLSSWWFITLWFLYEVSSSFQTLHSSKFPSRHDPPEGIPTEDELWFKLMKLILTKKNSSTIVLANAYPLSPLNIRQPHLWHKLQQHHVIPQSAPPTGPTYFIFIPSEEMVYFAALLSERFP